MWSSPATPAISTSRVFKTSVISPYHVSFYASPQSACFPNFMPLRFRNQKRCCISRCSLNNTGTPATPSVTPTTVMFKKKRKRYRKECPGESKGIVEEMRFVAMRLRNDNVKNGRQEEVANEDKGATPSSSGNGNSIWVPSVEGFLKYLVDSKLVFETLDRIVDESNHVAYSYFRKTGLERSQGLSKDLEWFHQQNIVIPTSSTPGTFYADYLDTLSEKCAPSFLSHFYNIYFAHISGGQVITKQVSEKLLGGRVLEFCKWEGDVLEMLKDVREKLNNLGAHWSREEKRRCLKEAAKSFRFSGQIVRLITS